LTPASFSIGDKLAVEEDRSVVKIDEDGNSYELILYPKIVRENGHDKAVICIERVFVRQPVLSDPQSLQHPLAGG